MNTGGGAQRPSAELLTPRSPLPPSGPEAVPGGSGGWGRTPALQPLDLSGLARTPP
jgi:hypothetical protein